MKRPRVFGLTGSIGSGKSTAARLLSERGIPVVSADALARDVVVPGAPALVELVEAFGPAIVRPDGTLDRAKLGALTLGHAERRALLNSILHPKIREGAERAFGALGAQGHDLAAYDIPLLFETSQEELLRPVVVVSAPEPKRLERVLQRDAGDPLDFYRKQGAQLPLDEKLSRADFVLDNSGSPDELAAQIEPLIAKVRAFLRL